VKLASWNVNSLKVRLPQLRDWLAGDDAPDILCLQETKLEDRNFPLVELAAAGYRAVFSGQKTYNGVALLAREEVADKGGVATKGGFANIQIGNPHFPDAQQRLIAATVGGIRVICAYFPNGEAIGSEKFAYKLSWLAALRAWLREELERHPHLALCGDFNIAPEDADTHDPEKWRGNILCSDAERQAFRDLLALGMEDSFRLFPQAEKSFSWWDYRMLGFQKNRGLRIDHILLSQPLARRAAAAGIARALRKHERPSDHAPVWVELAEG
jgi:exodeoxyribonuclease-3